MTGAALGALAVTGCTGFVVRAMPKRMNVVPAIRWTITYVMVSPSITSNKGRQMRLSSIFGPTSGAAKRDAEALERAADMAHKDGDTEHEKRLREAALFKRRVAREREAGFEGWSPMAFKDL